MVASFKQRNNRKKSYNYFGFKYQTLVSECIIMKTMKVKNSEYGYRYLLYFHSNKNNPVSFSIWCMLYIPVSVKYLLHIFVFLNIKNKRLCFLSGWHLNQSHGYHSITYLKCVIACCLGIWCSNWHMCPCFWEKSLKSKKRKLDY